MKKQKQIGWICRCWTQTVHGWTSDFATFDTREDAEEHGRIHNSLIQRDDLAREFEVYKNATDPF